MKNAATPALRAIRSRGGYCSLSLRRAEERMGRRGGRGTKEV
jgi:hypothetical protein